MAVITPQSDVMLVKVPLEIDNNNQLTFANATAQFNYFNSLPKISYDDFTYIRKDGVLRIPAVMDDILSYNYVMYRNDAYSSKWFYAYITGMEYVNDSVTDVSIATDTWQTWQFDLSYKRTFVEREHTNDDTIGSNLLPENLELGEYVSNGNPLPTFDGKFYCVINSTYDPYTNTKYLGTNAYGVPMAGNLFVFRYWTQMANALQGYSDKGRLESIAQVYAIPRVAFDIDDLDIRFDPAHEDDEHEYDVFTGNGSPRKLQRTLSRTTTLNTYQPRNNKLLTAPYQCILVTNNNGSSTSLAYEYFANPNNIVISTEMTPTVGGSIMVYPENYKGIAKNYNECLMAGKYPALSWSGDTYTNWLTQNAVNIGTGIVSDLLGAGLGIASGNYYAAKHSEPALGVFADVQGANSIFGGISSTLGQVYQHSLVSQSIKGNVNGGDVLTAGENNQCIIYQMSITRQFAERIDSYFDMYGYQTNTVKVPNITGRRNWNYVKTVGCYIEADIPQEDLQEIKLMFDKGITFWHNPATFCDYSQNNDII